MARNRGVRRGDSVRIAHPKTIPHSHGRIVGISEMWPRPPLWLDDSASGSYVPSNELLRL